ncbi:SDR family NAD(P)-dependent oxidoreductase [Salinirussus salinus]|jgi:NAD(P)-dependent dehydrogenase (short-subunit alcohol dehydrogenase family)|uniref:SDR family NAD(P)-dependent oxidoreductase n=1 Tax=Salinirussus salinus TaxID=1198300 RepID=UPI001356ED10|nr:glucose 1-dehydrogenase [Salinirussus salinus]
MRGLDGAVAVVTGASSGIGRASAERFAAEGASVVVADIDEAGGTETVERIEDDGGEATFVEVDVSDPDSVQAMVDATVERYGSLDVAHNNAGILTDFVPVTEIEESDWDTLIDVNLKGVWACLKAEIPAMLESNGGAVVNTTSEEGLVGGPARGSYVASKHGVVGLTRTAALEFADAGLRVNAVAPGPIDTGMSPDSMDAEDLEGMREAVREEIPLGRFGEPEEVAGATAYLCSEDASFVTGHTLVVDGGHIA